MKKTLLIISLFCSFSVFAQKFEIAPSAGFTFGGKIVAEEVQMDFHSSVNYGISTSYFFNEKHGMCFDYNFQPTSVDIWYKDYSTESIEIDINLSWFQIGYIYNTNYKKFKPFVGFSIGSTYFQPKDNYLNASAVFSLTGFGGVNFELKKNFGLQLKAKFLYPSGFGEALEYNNGVDQINYTTNLVQGSIGLGIYYKF